MLRYVYEPSSSAKYISRYECYGMLGQLLASCFLVMVRCSGNAEKKESLIGYGARWGSTWPYSPLEATAARRAAERDAAIKDLAIKGAVEREAAIMSGF